MLIRELPVADGERWDAYVVTAPGGLPQHLFGWQDVLRQVYGYETRYLVAEHAPTATANGAGNRITGVMPLYVVQSALVGRTVTTMPGGLCADDDETGGALIAAGAQFAAEINAKRFVIHDSRHRWPGDLQTDQGHQAWIVDVRQGKDAIWNDLDRNIRRQVRMAMRNELTVEVDRSGGLLDDFYGVLSRFAHAAGTPVFGRDFLKNVVKRFSQRHNIVVVFLDGKPIGGYFQLEMGNTNFGVWGAALHEYLNLRPVYLAYWRIIEDTVESGFEYLDMGRAPLDSNASKYKGQWTGHPAPIYQQTIPLQGSLAGGAAAIQAQTDGKFRLVRQLWPKLPYSVDSGWDPSLGAMFRSLKPVERSDA